MIEPTSPLREISDIEEGIKMLISNGYGSVVSVCESEGEHPSFSYRKDSDSKIIPFTGKQQPTFVVRISSRFTFWMGPFMHLMSRICELTRVSIMKILIVLRCQNGSHLR